MAAEWDAARRDRGESAQQQVDDALGELFVDGAAGDEKPVESSSFAG